MHWSLAYLKTIELMHYLNLSVTGNRFRVWNSSWDICVVLFNCRQKRMNLFWEIWILTFIFLVNTRLICFCKICKRFSSAKPKRSTAYIHTSLFKVYLLLFFFLFFIIVIIFFIFFICLFVCWFLTEFLG